MVAPFSVYLVLLSPIYRRSAAAVKPGMTQSGNPMPIGVAQPAPGGHDWRSISLKKTRPNDEPFKKGHLSSQPLVNCETESRVACRVWTLVHSWTSYEYSTADHKADEGCLFEKVFRRQ